MLIFALKVGGYPLGGFFYGASYRCPDLPVPYDVPGRKLVDQWWYLEVQDT